MFPGMRMSNLLCFFVAFMETVTGTVSPLQETTPSLGLTFCILKGSLKYLLD